MQDNEPCFVFHLPASARLAQSAERKALNRAVVGSGPTVGAAAQKHMRLTADTCHAMTGASEPGQVQTTIQINSLQYPGIFVHPLAPPVLCHKTTRVEDFTGWCLLWPVPLCTIGPRLATATARQRNRLATAAARQRNRSLAASPEISKL